VTAVATHIRLRKAARGDATAFAAVYESHHQALYRYCRSILRNPEDAQDALQSTMAKAFAALQTEQRDIDVKPWLFRIAHNEAISILRRRRETTELGDVPELAAIEDRVFEREELRNLQLDLADLPERQRAALVLRELNGLSHAEIAAVLETTPSAVKHTIFEARTSLFACREGREMGCHDVRRMLSDGDGRILRGRGLRAHLRNCSDCRLFQADLERRPVALKLLAPPLPTAAAASLLSGLLGGGGTAAKLLACIVIAGGGATVAVETHESGTQPAASAATATAKAKHASPPAGTRVPAAPAAGVVAKAPASTPAMRTASVARPGTRTSASRPERPKATAHGRAKPPRATAPGHLKHPSEPAKALAPGQVKKIGKVKTKAPKATPPGQAKKQAAKTPPGQAKKQAAKTPPGQAKKQAAKTPPGQAKKEAAKTPPGQAKKEAAKTPPGQANKQADKTPPGQADKGTPPGQDKKTAPPPPAPAESQAPPPSVPPGQAKKAEDPTPPGQAKKEHK
jgi:RNA polymerase sigma factor (sigma-70 family)